jgi:divalent metal cation (Fe/Co/Zn/Cd) transporter
MDSIDPALLGRAEAAALASDGVEAVASLRARWIGHSIHAEAELVADCDLTLSQAHAIAERARHAMLHAVPKLASVTVHVDPCGHDGQDPHAGLAHHDQPSQAIRSERPPIGDTEPMPSSHPRPLTPDS